jgi:Ca2+-binding RTX toxin-like protein
MGTSGPTNPYPLTMDVSNVYPNIKFVAVDLEGLAHTFPDDIDVELVAPGGQGVVLISDAGGGFDVPAGTTLSFFEGNPPLPAAPDSTRLVSGIPPTSAAYRPTNYGVGDPFPPPAPSASFGTSLSVFKGSNPNGTWRLYVNDDTPGEKGQFDTWDLQIFSEPDPGRCSNPFSLTNGQDFFFGGRGGDRVFARGGPDIVRTNRGDDCVSGGPGRDVVRGGEGQDQISGNSGNDQLTGDGGNDRLWGNSGRDRLSGRSGSDRLSGGRGGDKISAGPDRDRILGDSGNDSIRAKDGLRDRVNCGAGGRDRVRADAFDRIRNCETVRH